MNRGYESFFGLQERPFSLTSDPRFFCKSRSHGRAVEALTFGLRSRERCLVLTGDLGVGKTIVCRTLAGMLRRRAPVSFVPNPLLTADAFTRLLTDDLGATASGDLPAAQAEAIILIDEAHIMPPAVVDRIVGLMTVQDAARPAIQCIFVGQSSAADPVRLGIQEIDDLAATRVRLLPLCRDECAGYVNHRLAVAGVAHRVKFSSRALDYLFTLSGGVPRLVNLLCERALQEAAGTGSDTIEPATVDLAAATLQLLRARSRKFRWYSKRVS